MESVFRRPVNTDRNINASLYFGNLDSQVNELLLYELLIQVAPIKSLNLPKDKILKTHQGYGFVEFKNVRDAEYALNVLRGIRVFGRTLRIKRADPHKNQLAVNSVSLSENTDDVDVGAKLFIKNLNPLIDDQFLAETFSKFGKLIVPPSIVKDSDTGESKGYGFLTYNDFKVSDEVIKRMNGIMLMNSKISISYAFKEDPINGHKKPVKHGDKVERLLAENARSNNVLPLTNSAYSRKLGKFAKPK